MCITFAWHSDWALDGFPILMSVREPHIMNRQLCVLTAEVPDYDPDCDPDCDPDYNPLPHRHSTKTVESQAHHPLISTSLPVSQLDLLYTVYYILQYIVMTIEVTVFLDRIVLLFQIECFECPNVFAGFQSLDWTFELVISRFSISLTFDRRTEESIAPTNHRNALNFLSHFKVRHLFEAITLRITADWNLLGLKI